MSIPTSTWRIQFRNGMTFDRAADLIPYLQRLGISHLYASPIFTATSGSTHGYDVTNPNEIDPEIGGRAGFDRLVSRLKAAKIGLILDIVPNHMAASLENPWWRDVIENGEQSRYAHHFDIDWSRRLTLPFLGDTFEALLQNDEIAVKPDPATGKPAFACYDCFYPLAPATWQERETEILQLTDKDEIAALHDSQPWRLMSWRDAARDLSYRRFFEIAGLVGVRVEDEAVFDDAHRLILELVHSGAVDGLRVDHVDGLADPQGYLARLRQHAGPECYLTVEKILGKDEHLPADWPVSGTTGYEFIAALSDALVDGGKVDTLRHAYEETMGKAVDVGEELRAAKLLMVNRNFEGEFTTLLRLATAIADTAAVAIEEPLLRTALRELLVAFPVYRTYGTTDGLPPAEAERLAEVVEKVRASDSAPNPAALDFIVAILAGDIPEAAAGDAAVFRTRFQQLTGPLMAKSVEDTLFFRLHMALALNEVGAEPLPRTFSVDRFHHEMQTRLERQPDALSGTSTHDTKRGEDARARLYTLTEVPERWAECVARWREMNRPQVKVLDDGPAPKPAIEWMLYQALAGVWPPTLQPHDEEGIKALEARFLPFIEKALREAKLRTDWADNNDDYENAVLDYARHLLSSKTFLQEFTDSLQPFIRAGLVNSLTQTVIKLTAPGVPDIYQGSEALDFSLVDPDNRREPDFTLLDRQLGIDEKPDFSEETGWLSGQLKLQVIARLLHLRQERPTLFRKGDYLPLNASGGRAEKALAFARVEQDAALIVVAPRLVFDTVKESLPPALWEDMEIDLPESLANRSYRNVLTGETLLLANCVSLESGNRASVLILQSE